MIVLGVLLLMLGLMCLFISIFVLLIRAIMRKSIKNTARFSGISVIAIIAGFIIICVSPDIEESYETADAGKTTAYVEETSKAEEKNVLDTMEDEEYLEENAGGFYIDEDGEAIAVEGIMPEDTYFNDDEEISDMTNPTLNIEDVQKCIFPISEYPYQNTKKAKKLMKTYNTAMKADIEDFVYVEEISKGGILAEEKIRYKKTIDKSSADYKYYGKLNKNSETDGTGILLSLWDDDIPDDYLAAVYYIGEFNNGYKEGYGIEYYVDIDKLNFTVKYEGEFKKGKYEGAGVDYYTWSSVARDYPDIENELSWLIRIGQIKYEKIEFPEDSKAIDEDTYNYLFPPINGNNLITYPLIASFISYKGKFKDGKHDGKGIEYQQSWDSGQRCTVNYKYYEGKFKKGRYNGQGTSYFQNGKIKYKGEFKNGSYNGKGTLYDEQGNVRHKGKFKNGDVN